MNGFFEHIARHAASYGLGGGALLIAGVKCMPRPGTPASWLTFYTWIYNTLQTVLPTPHLNPPEFPGVAVEKRLVDKAPNAEPPPAPPEDPSHGRMENRDASL